MDQLFIDDLNRRYDTNFEETEESVFTYTQDNKVISVDFRNYFPKVKVITIEESSHKILELQDYIEKITTK